MGIRAERDPNTLFVCNLQEGQIQVLPIRVTIDLKRFVEFRGGRENARPVRAETQPLIIDAATRMPVNVPIRHSRRPIFVIIHKSPNRYRISYSVRLAVRTCFQSFSHSFSYRSVKHLGPWAASGIISNGGIAGDIARRFLWLPLF